MLLRTLLCHAHQCHHVRQHRLREQLPHARSPCILCARSAMSTTLASALWLMMVCSRWGAVAQGAPND